MRSPQFPFKTPGYYITQGYYDNANNYYGGKHGGLDIVPLDGKGNTVWLANEYAPYGGAIIDVQNTDVARGKGVRTRNLIYGDLVEYLKKKGYIPKNLTTDVYLETLFWHCNEVTDLDGEADINTPVAKCGNTGLVYTSGNPVPDALKGKPPYPGLHLHYETVLKTDTQTLNLDKDYQGRIDPLIILNYTFMSNVKIVDNKGEFSFLVPATTGESFIDKGLNFGIQIPKLLNGDVDWSKVKADIVIPKT